MLITIFAVVLLIALLLGIPVVFGLGFTSIFVIAMQRGIADIPFAAIAQRLVFGINNFPILAIPCFILVGKLMNTVGVTERIFRFANSLVGHFHGGLGHANVVASLIFSGMSGSAVGDIVAMGPIELKAMKDAGFPHRFSVAITADSSLIGPIIPPSIPMVFYGVLAGVSIGTLFIGGIIPGLLMASSLMVWVYYKARREHYPKGELKVAEIWDSFKGAFVPLWTPVILNITVRQRMDLSCSMALSRVNGLPKRWLPRKATWSLPIIRASGKRLATALAFAMESLSAVAAGLSPATTDSSVAGSAI